MTWSKRDHCSPGAAGEIDGVGVKEFPLKARGEEPPPVKLFEMR